MFSIAVPETAGRTRRNRNATGGSNGRNWDRVLIDRPAEVRAQALVPWFGTAEISSPNRLLSDTINAILAYRFLVGQSLFHAYQVNSHAH